MDEIDTAYDANDASMDKDALFALLLAEDGFDIAGTRVIPSRKQKENPPLSFTQERLWFLEQLTPGSAAYNIVVAYKLTGTLDVEILRRSLNEVVRRHEVLRTTFAVVEEQVVQVISPTVAVPLSVTDLYGEGNLADADLKAKTARLLKEAAERAFDLQRGTAGLGFLLRMNIIRTAPTEHVLQLIVHHSVFDGWSINVFFRELTALYNAFLAEQPSPLPEVALQYADVAVWQRDWLQGEVLEEQLGYWREQLSGAPALLNVPTDRPRPAMQSFHGATTAIKTLPQAVGRGLRQLCQQEGVTMFMTLLAAFQVLLVRYTGQEDVVVGTPIANRSQIELEGVIGYLVNTLVLRGTLSGNPRFVDVLKQARETALGAYAHQDVPFEKVVEALQPERSLSHSPLFQVLFMLQVADGQRLQLAGIETTQLEVAGTIAKFDLTLFVLDKGEELEVQVEYNSDLFDETTIERLVGHYQQLLEGILAEPEAAMGNVPLLTAGERHQLLEEWNTTQAAYPRHATVHEMFEAQVKLRPDAVAGVFEEQALSYRELDDRANALCEQLRSLSVGREVLVGICLERSLAMVVGLLGILKAGGAYVPLDPSYPQERLAFMLADAQVAILLTQTTFREKLQVGEKTRVVCLEGDPWNTPTWKVADESGAKGKEVSGDDARGVATVDAAGRNKATADNLMYVIYTSGSTGKPKGTQISHAAVLNFLYAMRERPGLSEQDTLLAITSLSFDIAGLEMFLPLLVGACLVVVSGEGSKDGSTLAQSLQRYGATCMQATPATWRLLLEAGWRGLEGLKMLCGGEALPADLATQLLTKGASLWNMYGPTETTIWSLVAHVEQVAGQVSIGRPIANTQVYVLDAHLEPVPIGVPGALFIGGDGLSRGYLWRPELTAERFIPDPFSAIAGRRMYQTGDVARYHADGSLEFLGRGDSQVKIRGFRIELGEIEAVLTEHPAVRQCVVVAREDGTGEKQLVAYVVPQEGMGAQRKNGNGSTGSPDLRSSKLRSFLQGKLPEYMLPAAFVVLDAFPLTPNGKVDRKALPDVTEVEVQREETYEAPRTPVEEIVAQLYGQVLQREDVGIRDNFFALGGHSLLATQFIARVRQTFQMDIPLYSLFETPTVAGLAETLVRYETAPGRVVAIAQVRQKMNRMSEGEKQALLQRTKERKG